MNMKETMMSNYLWILDAGHGGEKDGVYTTAPAKMFKFGDGFEIREGVINRAITKLLYQKLQADGINFVLVYDDVEDTPLAERVAIADRLFTKNPNAIYLSIHSNAGQGKGFEVFTSKGQNKSDKVAYFFCEKYKELFPYFAFRADQADGDADKEEDFYVLRKTDCPALLVENLFFDNRTEAEFLASDAGQEAIAECLFQSIKIVEQIKPI